ncbi:MAG: cytochrome c [Deltaproteobacteria bacterium]
MKITRSIGSITLALAAALAACRGSSAASPTKDTPAPPAKPAPAAAGMDARTPLPLTTMMATHQKQEMRDHLRVVQEITAALVKDDFAAIGTSAARIGWSDQQAMMCKHMGAGAPGFAEVGEHFHKTADTIAEAAKRHDHAGVTAALDATLRTCVGCHETYRQEIVDAAAFTKATGTSGMDANCPMMRGK